MYLSRLHISKFRVFDDITLYFKNGINILILSFAIICTKNSRFVA